MPRLALLILATSFAAASALAPRNAMAQADKNWEQVCKAAKAHPLPGPQLLGPLTSDQLPDCDERDLYYGFGKEPNYPGALQCGWYQYSHPQHRVGNMFCGPGVLAMLYANGKGVARNYDAAIRLACENPWAAEAEMAYRVGHLERLRDDPSQTATFDLCDDITSGLSDGFCTSIQTQRADAVREAKIAEIVDKLAPVAKSVFPKLQKAETAFEDIREENEIDLSGTSRAAFQLEDQALLREQFLTNLTRFGKGDIPPDTESDLVELDRKLNEAYQAIQHSPQSRWEYVTVKPEGIQKTERAWVALADEWIAFAAKAYPDISSRRIRAQLIRLRLHQLRSL